SAELAQYYRAADLFVHPGVEETFGLVALESQACGTPVVGIRGSWMDRIIFHPQDDWARENTPKALAAAIAKVSRQDLRALGMAAAASAAERHGWPRVFAGLFAVYEEIIGGSG
ncbi:MAG: glycosyltransferase, partial [Verrucomicrobiota bacterium]|nr:glycosyltransferase [Verrucomicrobiota bacterium]